ncbi:Flavin-nucleotide-binding protein [Arthrobacter sp. 9AX]|uniref:pyridoxamine 5'-phosphate oxidase family protein n=1 Tax=Arthrobacter sp. 9AX TaxID=2653131 RepID=UPI0012F42BD0|nr:pyridoxamine 5'-phosphate oxidase family protein [Arthrobacter sp. 9AX]VXC23066.1 Flavin-nucleotide-binding protein [Arthrobacter sp. 9AX]
MTDKNMVPEAEVLDSSECWKLLEHTSVGRLAVVVDGQPDVFPVSFKLDGEDLLFRTGEGKKLQAMEANSLVALEADSVSAEFGLAWSVVVKGKAVQDDAAGPALNETRRGLFPWQGVGQDHLIRIVPQSVTGRRFTLSTAGTWRTPLDEATRAGLE